MNFKRFRVAIMSLFIIFALGVSFEGIVQANAIPETARCRAMLPECFPVGSPMWKKMMIREGMLPKLPEDETSSSAEESICAGSGCALSDAEKTSRELSKEGVPVLPDSTISSTLRDKKPCICEGTVEVCDSMCGRVGSDSFGKQFD
jgi:hypothetical protein